MVEYYLAPHNVFIQDRIVSEIGQQPQGIEILISRDFNAYLPSLYFHKNGKAILAMEGIEDMAAHLLHRHSPWTRYG